MKVHVLTESDGKTLHGWHFFCPACKMAHSVPVASGITFNGNQEAPTFQPSIAVTWGEGYGEDRKPRRCHSFIIAGEIQFLADSTHELAGKTIPLPDLAE